MILDGYIFKDVNFTDANYVNLNIAGKKLYL